MVQTRSRHNIGIGENETCVVHRVAGRSNVESSRFTRFSLLFKCEIGLVRPGSVSPAAFKLNVANHIFMGGDHSLIATKSVTTDWWCRPRQRVWPRAFKCHSGQIDQFALQDCFFRSNRESLLVIADGFPPWERISICRHRQQPWSPAWTSPRWPGTKWRRVLVPLCTRTRDPECREQARRGTTLWSQA